MLSGLLSLAVGVNSEHNILVTGANSICVTSTTT